MRRSLVPLLNTIESHIFNYKDTTRGRSPNFLTPLLNERETKSRNEEKKEKNEKGNKKQREKEKGSE